MRLATIAGRAALVDGDRGLDVARASEERFPSDMVGILDRWPEFLDWSRALHGGEWTPYSPDQLGPPVPNPRQVFALAVNYVDHASEAGMATPANPYVFTKFPSCITGPYDDVLLPSNRADWEVELVVIIGRPCSSVPEQDAWSHVAGVTVGQDISERRVQFRKPFPHLSVAKSFPTFGPTGPWLVTPDELSDPDDLALTCSINGERMQDGRTSDMVFSVTQAIAEISSMVTLLPGDLIFTGTPSGVGSTQDPRRYLAPGDVIDSTVEGVGAIRNVCVLSSNERN